MAELLNAVIRLGGTTALTEPVDRHIVTDWMTAGGDRATWTVAESEMGRILGFQWIEPHADLPPEAADIATFVAPGHHGLGVGTALFETTRAAAASSGYRWINASIRADNLGGLAYYQSRGFEDWGRLPSVRLANGHGVDKILKRYDLT